MVRGLSVDREGEAFTGGKGYSNDAPGGDGAVAGFKCRRFGGARREED